MDVGRSAAREGIDRELERTKERQLECELGGGFSGGILAQRIDKGADTEREFKQTEGLRCDHANRGEIPKQTEGVCAIERTEAQLVIVGDSQAKRGRSRGMKGKQRPQTQRGGQAKGALAAEILAGLGKEGGVGADRLIGRKES